MICVLLADGFEEIEALAFVDILRRAEIDVKTISANNTQTVTGAHNIKVVPDMLLKDISGIQDGIILPGGLPGTYNLQKNDEVIKLINKHNENGKFIAAICAAPSIFGEMGLLNQKNATCYPSFETHLHGACYKTDRVVRDGNIITSRGAGTAHDFAFKFVELIRGADLAKEIKDSMLYE